MPSSCIGEIESSMKQLQIFVLLVLGLGAFTFVEALDRIAAAKVCVGTNKCVGSAWPMTSIEKAYGVSGKAREVEELIKELCIQRKGVYLRVRYDLRSAAGLKRPAALDIASNGPPEKCEATSVGGPTFNVGPVALGESEAKVRRVLGEPDEIWESQTSSHGILVDERGFVYGGPEGSFVLVVLRNHVVVRIAGSVLP